jgi:hypothetical protein
MNDDRNPEQAARDAPVSIPAGSFDSAELQKALDEAAKPKNDDKREELIAQALGLGEDTAAEAPADPAPNTADPAPAAAASKGE